MGNERKPKLNIGACTEIIRGVVGVGPTLRSFIKMSLCWPRVDDNYVEQAWLSN